MHSEGMAVLAIGGSASVGKTTLASRIVERLGLECVVHVDDLGARAAVSVGPSFIDTTPNVWTQPVTWLRDALIASTRNLRPFISAEIDAMVEHRAGGVIEGEGLEPQLFRRWPAPLVQPIYVIEDDATRLRETFARRASGARFLARSEREQEAVVEMNRAYGLWLRRQAERCDQPWVAAFPWGTLPDRVLAHLSVR
jgi:2-phosphoglycerate kinase